MTVYPNQIDNDLDILRIEDNLTQTGADTINALRDATFAIEETLGINPQGTKGTLVDFLGVSFNSDGTIKTSVLTSAGLATLPITNSQIAAGAGIVESKLNLDYSTATLNAAISALTSTVNGVNSVITELDTNFTLHIYGKVTPTTSDGYVNRHVGSHIDINNGEFNGYPQYTGVDPRDTSYNNPGLYDLSGNIRNARTVMKALIQINNDFLSHALSTSTTKHLATFVSVDTSNFDVIPTDKDNVQLVLDFIDDYESEIIEKHRAEQHSDGIPRASIVESYENDGYNTIFGTFECSTSTTSGGLGQVSFTATPGELDWAFRQIVPGDIVQINYGGYIADHTIDTITYTPGATYNLTIDGYILSTSSNIYGLLKKSKYDDNHYGALGVASVNHNYYDPPNDAAVPGSAIVVSPNCAAATGLDFAPDDLDTTHYMLYIAYYPTGDPADVNLVPPTNILGIDVTGNKGVTPGKYDIQYIVKTTNRAFREGGYNYRFVAFEYKGQFGIALADVIDNAAFSIISGTASGTTLGAGAFTNNVVGDATSPIKDPLGLGYTKANVASPDYQTPTSTSLPTRVITRKVGRKYNINGQYIDYLKKGHLTNSSGYYDGYFYKREVLGTTRTRGVYRVSQNLENTELKIGSTIVVYPAVDRTDSTFKEQDYGRFIVEDLDYGCCPGDDWTDITVITCTSLTGDPNFIATTPPPNLAVKIYFSEDSVTFENNDGSDYRNLFEVFVKREGETYSHKRARFELKAPSNGRELDTSIGTTNIYDGYGWHIVDASPKLRGFLPATAAATDLRKFVRFVINNYDSTDDSYDGYIGQPDDSSVGGILNTGPVTRVRKGNIGRYYDNTAVDYVEIRFTENLITSALDISVPPGEFRYVDIEIFDTMRLNEEQMCLAVCEQTSSGASKTFVDYFIDKRQFGTVSERNLTTSAIQFIEASDRLFRQNGIARGFEYKGMSGNNLVFNGGTAVVNGTIVNTNNFTVFPFELSDGLLPTTVNYAICLRSDGTHELVIVNSSSSTTEEYTTGREIVYTLSELIATRKDLLPLWVFTVVTASLTVNPTLEDVRKFIANAEINSPLTLVGPTDESNSIDTRIGNFASWDAVSNYIKYAGFINSTILVKGDTTISSTVDFNEVPVTIKGEKGNIVRCTANVGINLQSHIVIDGINFMREVDGYGLSYSTSGYSKGTLVFAVSGNTEPVMYNDVVIKNCSFDTTSGYQASGYAHILFEETGPRSRSIFKNIKILNNRFLESLFPQLDIAFVDKSGDVLSDPTDYSLTGHGTILNSVTIDGNTGAHNSWIMLSSDNYNSGSGSSRGLSAYGVRIINNNFTHLWYNLSRYLPTGYNGTSYGVEYNNRLPIMNAEFDVQNNSFNDIINRAIDGTLLGIDETIFSLYVYKQVDVASPSINISNNRCTSIAVSINGDLYNDGTYDYPKSAGSIQIVNNIIQSSPYNGVLFNPSSSYASTSQFFAIGVSGNMTMGHEKKNLVKINGNIISNEMKSFGSLSGSQYDYLYPIFTSTPADIQNNTIEQCIYDTSSSGIWLNYIHPSTSGHGDNTYTSQVTNNTITRGSTDIYSYILIGGDDKINSIAVKDNLFDGYTVVDSPTTVADHYAIKFNATPYEKVSAQRNVGQMFFTDLTPNVNTNYGEHIYAGGSPYDAVGWRTYNDVTVSAGVSLTTLNEIRTCLDLSTYANGSYYVLPFVVNVPSYDGASGLALSFYVSSNIPATNIRVYASSQYGTDRSYAVSVPTTVIYPVRNITNSVDNYFVTSGGDQLMHVDISTLYSTYYTSYVSTDKYFPIYLLFVQESSPLSMISMTKSSSVSYQYIKVDQILGQFRY